MDEHQELESAQDAGQADWIRDRLVEAPFEPGEGEPWHHGEIRLGTSTTWPAMSVVEAAFTWLAPFELELGGAIATRGRSDRDPDLAARAGRKGRACAAVALCGEVACVRPG